MKSKQLALAWSRSGAAGPRLPVAVGMAGGRYATATKAAVFTVTGGLLLLGFLMTTAAILDSSPGS